jgi:GTP-binding protein Era
VFALNKVDRLKPDRIAVRIAEVAGLGDFHALHPVSGLTGDGVDALRAELVGLLPEGPAYFPDGDVTDLPLEARVAELVREAALALTREEVPHAVTAQTEELEERRVAVTLFVETDSQKGILVGKGGRMIREIGSRARPEIERLLGRGVFLELTVKVRPRWRRDEAMLTRMGI